MGRSVNAKVRVFARTDVGYFYDVLFYGKCLMRSRIRLERSRFQLLFAEGSCFERILSVFCLYTVFLLAPVTTTDDLHSAVLRLLSILNWAWLLT